MTVPGSEERKHELIMQTPATDWRDGLPSGNGRLGAVHFGNVHQDRLLLNHETLWAGGMSPQEVPDVSDLMPELRRMLAEGRYEEANSFLPDKMREGNCYSEARYQPLANLFIELDFEDAYRDYSRTLDMSTGELRACWADGDHTYTKRAFVSRVHDVVGFHIECSKAGSICAKFGLGPHPFDEAVAQNGAPAEPTIETETEARGSTLYYHGHQIVEDNAFAHPAKSFGAVAQVRNEGGSANVDRAAVEVRNADAVTVWIKLYVNKDGAAAKYAAEIDSLGTFDELFEAHAGAHRAIFLRQKLDLDCADERALTNEALLLNAGQGHLPAALAERMFDYGRYLLMCSSAPGCMPANLQGVWNGEYRPPWNSFYMNNENVQMNYWLALPGNLREATEAYFEYYESRLDDFRANAQRIFGCRGINIPAFSSDHGGLNRALHPHCLHWTGAAGWLAALFYDYWLFTGDREFLKSRALPFLREVALFYQDFFIEGDDGLYVSMPSNSPENVPPQHEERQSGQMAGHRGKRISIAINATMDFAIAKEVLTNLIDGYTALGEEPDRLNTWQEMLAKIPPYEINEDGALKEWVHPDFPDNYEHRHESHIYPVFPGFELDRDATPELFEACRVALDKRKVIGLKDQTGWSLAHMANARARLGEGEKAHRALEILAQTCIGANLFTYHNDYRFMGPTVTLAWGQRPPFQIDANFGWTAAMLEMLAFSKPGLIRILPALPKAWRRGRIENLCCRSGITLTIAWDDGQVEAQLLSQTTQTVNVVWPGPDAPQALDLCGGEAATVHWDGLEH